LLVPPRWGAIIAQSFENEGEARQAVAQVDDVRRKLKGIAAKLDELRGAL